LVQLRVLTFNTSTMESAGAGDSLLSSVSYPLMGCPGNGTNGTLSQCSATGRAEAGVFSCLGYKPVAKQTSENWIDPICTSALKTAPCNVYRDKPTLLNCEAEAPDDPRFRARNELAR
jgi:hypothetical protein